MITSMGAAVNAYPEMLEQSSADNPIKFAQSPATLNTRTVRSIKNKQK